MDKKTDSEKEGLVLSTRHATAYAAGALSVLSGFFIAGYFFGKNQAIDQFVAQVEPHDFTEQLAESLTALCNSESKELQSEQTQTIVAHQKKEVSGDGDTEKKQQFYAQLIGYGTYKAAARFSEKLKNQGIPVVVKTRSSSTAQGNKRKWYQVVTEPFTDRNTLEELTQQVAQHEKIQGIRILSCS